MWYLCDSQGCLPMAKVSTARGSFYYLGDSPGICLRSSPKSMTCCVKIARAVLKGKAYEYITGDIYVKTPFEIFVTWVCLVKTSFFSLSLSWIILTTITLQNLVISVARNFIYLLKYYLILFNPSVKFNIDVLMCQLWRSPFQTVLLFSHHIFIFFQRISRQLLFR